MKRIGRSAAFAALMMLAACSGTVRQPEIELEGVTLGSLGLGGGTLNVNLRVHNPNRFAIRADDLKYRLFLRRPAEQQASAGDSAWVEFADGTYPDTISVRGGETRTFRVPVEFTFGALRGAAGSLLQTGRLQYRAEGTVDVRTPIGRREVPFRKTGSFTMSGGGR
ncbi:MAG TPA: LEA type 2 family protein [Longimicrobium sp.]|nr:LEA type 2 family protein [Longimicrobium sp.]